MPAATAMTRTPMADCRNRSVSIRVAPTPVIMPRKRCVGFALLLDDNAARVICSAGIPTSLPMLTSGQ